MGETLDTKTHPIPPSVQTRLSGIWQFSDSRIKIVQMHPAVIVNVLTILARPEYGDKP
jgi:hypothetical protein